MTPDELDKMEQLWVSGARISEIAHEMSYSESTIEKTAATDRLRYPKRKGLTQEQTNELDKLWASRKPLSEISERMGIPKQTLQSIVARDRERFPYRHKYVAKEVIDMWVVRIEAGRATIPDVAEKLGVHPVTVAGWLKRGRK